MDSAFAALETLRAKSQPMADSLQTYLAAVARVRSQERRSAEPGAMPGLLPDARVAIGPVVLKLPAGAWFDGGSTRRLVRGGRSRPMISSTTQVEVVTSRAFSLDDGGNLAGSVALSTNPRQAFGISYWDVENPCDGPQGTYVHRFKKIPDQPECVDMRVIDPGATWPTAAAGQIWQAAAQAGVSWTEPAYRLHYAAYGLDRAVEVTALVPVYRFAGDVAAVQWLHAMAAQLRPLASHPANSSATLPALLSPSSADGTLPRDLGLQHAR
jgi:hypothetical protein